MAGKEKNLLMIVGMHRSGTSAVGRLMQCIGYEFGNNLLEGIQAVNDEGFWEDKDVVSLNQHIFSLYGFDWFDFERLPGKWWEEGRVKDLIGVAETWYLESFRDEKSVAVKDPRFCRLLPFWKRVFGGVGLDVTVLLVFRHPVEVAASLKKRDGFPCTIGYLLWLSYVIDALYYSRNMELELLNYEELISGQPEALDRLRGLIQDSGVSIGDFNACIEKSLDANLRRQRYENLANEITASGDIQLLACELYGELSESTSDSAKEIADKYRKRFYRLLDHHHEALSALRDEIFARVSETQNIFKLGKEHAHALAVIKERDAQLHESREYINRCLEDIKHRDSLLEQKLSAEQASIGSDVFSQKLDFWMEDLKKNLDDYRKQIVQQQQYIAECEEKISNQERGLADNQQYIARCHARIAEQDVGISENKGYIVACEDRIRAQDEVLKNRERLIEEKSNKILDQEGVIASAKEMMSSFEEQLAEFRDKNAHQNNEILALESKIEEHLRVALDYQIQLKGLNADIEAYRERISRQEEVLIDRHKKIEFLEIALFEQREKHGAASEKARSLDAMLNLSEQKNSDLNQLIQDQQRILGQQSERLYVLEANLSSAREEAAKIQEASNQIKIQFGEKSERIRLVEENLAASRNQVSELEKLLLDRQRVIGELSTGQNMLESQLLSSREKISENEQVIRDLEKSAFRKEQEFTEYKKSSQKEIDDLTEKQKSLETILRSTREENLRLEKTIQDLRLQLIERSERLRSLDDALSSSREQISQSEVSMMDCHREIGEKSEKIRVMEESLRVAHEQIFKNENTISDLQIALSNKQNGLLELEAQLQSRTSDLANLHQRLDSMDVKAQGDRTMIENFKAEIDKLQTKDRVTSQHLVLQKQQIEKLKAHSSALESEMVALRAEHEECLKQLDRYRSYGVVKALDRLFPEK